MEKDKDECCLRKAILCALDLYIIHHLKDVVILWFPKINQCRNNSLKGERQLQDGLIL